MSVEKVAVKNERPGIMLTPTLRPPEEAPEERAEDTKKEEERVAAKA